MSVEKPEKGLVQQRIDNWRRHLIDLSHRNRLIAFKATKATTLTIASPAIGELMEFERRRVWDFYFPPDPDEVDNADTSDTAETLDEIVLASAARASVRGAGQIAVTEPHPKRIARILDNLAKRSTAEYQDKAIRILYLAVGFLDWHDEARGKAISSPLVLVPVELSRDSAREPYRLEILQDEDIVINPSLTEKLKRDGNLTLPEDWAWEDKPISQELAEIRDAMSSTGWTVREDAVIGLFSFQKYVMYRDLLDHEQQVAAHPLVRSLAQGRLVDEARADGGTVPSRDELDDSQEPAKTLSILDSDASQRQCVEASKLGRSFVMHGPPGTGKSQTIANLIAEAIGQGKKVLFVSEKAAALDVVYNRLAASGLNEYCLMLHGEHAARREVVQTLDESLTTALVARPAMHEEELERLAHLRTLLNVSVQLLHLPWPVLAGRSLREVHAALAQLHDAPSVPGAPPATEAEGGAVTDEYQRLHEIFQRLSERWRVSAPDFVWRGYDAERLTADDQGRVRSALADVVKAIDELRPAAASLAGSLGVATPQSLDENDRVGRLAQLIRIAPQVDPRWLDPSTASALPGKLESARESHERVHQASELLVAEYPARAPSDFPNHVDHMLVEAKEEVSTHCGFGPSWLHQLPQLGQFLSHLDSAPELAQALARRASETQALLGQPQSSPTLADVEHLAQLADLSFRADHRPEEAWLVAAGLQKAEEALEAVRDDLETYQDNVSKLAASGYQLDVIDLDGAALSERFRDQYTSLFAKLGSAYRQDARLIKAAREDGKVPATLQADLTILTDARECAGRIDQASDRLKAALGSYARGRDTDVRAVREGLKAARTVRSLSDPDADLSVVAARVGVDSRPDPVSAQAADRLRAAAERVRAILPTLTLFITKGPDLSEQGLTQIADRLTFLAPGAHRLGVLVAQLDRGAVQSATSFAQVETRARLVAEAQAAEAKVMVAEGEWRDVIGDSYAGAETPWGQLIAAAGWLGELFASAGGALTPAVRELLSDAARGGGAGASAAADDVADRAKAAVRVLADMFDDDRAEALRDQLHSEPFVSLLGQITELDECVDDLHDWTEWRAWRRRARESRWNAFVDGLVARPVAANQVLPALQRAFWSSRLEALYEEERELSEDLRGGAFERWAEEFCQLDAQLVESGADRLIAKREGGRQVHVAAAGSQVDLLRREARKKRRHLPVRVLLSRIPSLLSDLKPCLMMSPLTVSHFLSAGHRFDLVLFDEASQVPPQDAINCIYRGDQLIVAGDDKQLPPTPFFQVAELDEMAPDEEESSTEEDMESVLDACSALLPIHSLKWHYRSRWEALIAFSNEQVYNGSLITFPSVEEQSTRMGIGFTHVPDGLYDRGRTASNRVEARVAARRVVDFLTDGTGRSVGVIAFNSAQAAAISEELDLLRVEHPQLEDRFRGDRLDAVFVKHLEAVQGDERDVIVLSVGYGRDANGKFTMNFGPLNKDGGHRRLNVAITRARERLDVVSSVRAHDFALAETSSRGAQMLRDYIRYAETAGAAQREPSAEAEQWSTPLEADIAQAVRTLAYEPVSRVGVGSFRVEVGVRDPERPDRFLLGIETDGLAYAETPTARDRERLRHAVLEGLGWNIHRIWSLDWVRARSNEIERLSSALASAHEAANAGDDHASVAPTEAEHANGDQLTARERVELTVHELDDAQAAAALPWTEVYQRAYLRGHFGGFEFHDASNRRLQAELIVELLEGESPVSIDYAIRRLAECWGLGRSGHRIVAAARRAISESVRRDGVDVRGEFLWRAGQTLTKVRVPDPLEPATRRDIDDIAPEEIDLALARIREASAGIADDQLVVQAARLFGYRHTGGRIRSVLEERVRTLGPSVHHQGPALKEGL